MATSGSRILQRFEQRLEGAVEGFFARAFRSGLQPVELAKGLRRYADTHRDIAEVGIVVPNVFRFRCHPKDATRLAGYGDRLLAELGEVVTASATEEAWLLRGPVVVTIEEDADVRVGTFRLNGRIDGTVSPPPAPPAPPTPPSTPQPPTPSTASPARPASATPPVGTPATPQAPARPAGIGAASPPPASPPPPASTPHASAPTGGLVVTVSAGPSAGASVALQGSRLVVGRLPESDLFLDDTTVSRAHAAFVRRADAWWVLDLGSTNGTRVNGRTAAEHPVKAGDEVMFGDAVVQIAEG